MDDISDKFGEDEKNRKSKSNSVQNKSEPDSEQNCKLAQHEVKQPELRSVGPHQQAES